MSTTTKFNSKLSRINKTKKKVTNNTVFSLFFVHFLIEFLCSVCDEIIINHDDSYFRCVIDRDISTSCFLFIYPYKSVSSLIQKSQYVSTYTLFFFLIYSSFMLSTSIFSLSLYSVCFFFCP